MPDLIDSIEAHKDLPEDAQKKAGEAIPGAMPEKHESFVKEVIALIQEGKIDPMKPDSFLKKDVYDGLDLEWKAKTDLAIVNISTQLQRIKAFYESDKTPNASPQLEQMIEELWQMKQRIEEHADVFVF